MRKIIIYSALIAFIIIIMSGCAAPKTVDTYCQTAPRGTAHVDDTMGTKRWMRTYEVTRRARCK